MSENRLADLEKIIETDRHKFYRIGKALRQIRNEKLFRQLLFDSFEAYVKDRWDMARSHAYRLIEAANVIDNLSPIGDRILPENEAQTRALARLRAFDQRRLWREFIQSGTPINAVNIRGFINQRTKKAEAGQRQKPTEHIKIISAGYKAAVMAMLEQINLAQNDHWQRTSRQAALFWLKVMKQKIVSNLHRANVK